MDRQTGTLKVWKDDKGFGFIKPLNGGKDAFVHIRDFGSIPRKPRVGDTILYQPMKDREGRLRAGDVQIQGVNRTASKAPKNTKRQSKHVQHKSGNRLVSSVISILLISLFGVFGYDFYQNTLAQPSLVSSEASATDAVLQQAFQNRQSDLQVTGSGVVIRILPDDLEGSRHQKFILRLSSGQTLLISHNIDLSDRIPSINIGDAVSFNGEYEWNRQGGVVHWTHHDPKGRHEAGWLKHQGLKYE